MLHVIDEIINKNDKNNKPISQIIFEKKLINVNKDSLKFANIFNDYFAGLKEKIATQI